MVGRVGVGGRGKYITGVQFDLSVLPVALLCILFFVHSVCIAAFPLCLLVCRIFNPKKKLSSLKLLS